MIVYGAGGLGRELSKEMGLSCCYADDLDDPSMSCGPDTWEPNSNFIAAVGNGMVRSSMVKKAMSFGHRPNWWNNGDYDPPGRLQPNVIIMKGSLLTVDITIEEGVLVNIGAMVGHDCILRKYCSIQPHANLSGCEVGPFAYIGMGANIVAAKDGRLRQIGASAVIGAGAVLTHDVMAGEVWVGNPARRIR